MKVKNMITGLCAAVMLFSMSSVAFAAEPEKTVVDLGDGFYLVETIERGPVTRAGDTVRGVKKGDLYQGSTLIGTAYLGGTFDISGSTAKAIDADITGTGYNGWSYDRGTTSLSGNRASGTAYFKSGSTTKNVTISLSCSPSGTLS